MAQIRLWVVGRDELQELFTSNGPQRERLLDDLGTRVDRPVAWGRSDQLGPLLRRAPDAPVVPPHSPVRTDAERLLDGRPVPPERAAASWALVEHWVEHLACARAAFPAEDAAVTAVARVWRALDLPLTPPPGTTAGWLTRQDVVRRGKGLPAALTGWLARLPAAPGQTSDVLCVVEA